MRSEVLIVAGAAVAAATNPLAELQKRQAQEIGEECQAALGESVEVVQSLPEPPQDPEFLRFLSEQELGEVGECEVPSVTGDAEQASVYTSWVSEMTEWVEANGDVLLNFLSACSDEPLVSSAIAEINLPVATESICSEYSFAQGGGSDVTETGSAPSATETGDDAASQTTSDAADETETGDADETESPSASESGDAEESESESPAAAPRQTGMAVAAMVVAGFAVAGIN